MSKIKPGIGATRRAFVGIQTIICFSSIERGSYMLLSKATKPQTKAIKLSSSRAAIILLPIKSFQYMVNELAESRPERKQFQKHSHLLSVLDSLGLLGAAVSDAV